ncbi:MAG TPA: hypothetical protein VFA56_08875 [Gaiellaceae bacterium]|nr:hypothetical protein [Gaiellaceae bacterium]
MTRINRLAGIVVAAAVAAGAASAAAPPPRLQLLREPPSVVGSNFRARERVTVTVGATVIRTRTTSLGTFRAMLSAPVPRCGGIFVRAAGARGDVATLKLPLPACMPAREP